jgi:hypothetical protein
MKAIAASKRILAVLAAALPAAVSGQEIPVRNWDVPAEGLSKLAVVQPSVFAPVSPPCRLDDSRLSSGGVGPIGPGGTRVYDFIPSGGVGCGALPANVVALSVFFTVVGPSGPGFLYAFPTGSPPGSPTSILNYNAGELKNAAAIVPVEPLSGAFTLGVGGAGTDVIIDLNGIFYNALTPSHHLLILANAPGTGAIFGQNTSTASGSMGVGGFTNGGIGYGVSGEAGYGSASGSAGVFGINYSNAASSFGVFGQISAPNLNSAAVRGLVSLPAQNSGMGVWGDNAYGTGVAGTSTTGFGVYGGSSSNFGVRGDSATAAGVSGKVTSNAAGVAGVVGFDGDAEFVPGIDEQVSAGVKGVSGQRAGVLGMTHLFGSGAGVIGMIRSSMNNTVSAGYLAFTGAVGVHAFGDITATGVKHFVEPHPTDPSRVIQFSALEGNEVGTYFRGKGKFERGLARIAVPEDFRTVTESEALSVQVTPIGEMASVAIVRIDLNEIVVKASRNVEFFYLVQGVRKGYAQSGSTAENEKFFVPEGPAAKMPASLSEEAKARLVRNGTYNADGTVNLETAKRLGWDKGWSKP